MAYPTHPRHQAAREALEQQKKQAAEQPQMLYGGGANSDFVEGTEPIYKPGRGPAAAGPGAITMSSEFSMPPREPAMGDAPPIPEVAPEAPAPEPGGPNLSEKSTEELQEGRRRLMARMMDEARGPQLEAMQKLADSIDRELSMRHGG